MIKILLKGTLWTNVLTTPEFTTLVRLQQRLLSRTTLFIKPSLIINPSPLFLILVEKILLQLDVYARMLILSTLEFLIVTL